MGNALASQYDQDGINNINSTELRNLIAETREKLRQTKLEGIAARDAQEEEIYKLQMELYEKKKTLMEKANQAQNAYSFGDYINVIQNTFTSEEIATVPVQTIIPDDGTTRPKTTDIVPQHFKLTYTIFAWFEAYLLKRLHMAMFQQRQKSIHSKSWSGVVADLYFEIPQLKKKFETKLGGLFLQKQNVEVENLQKHNAYADHVRVQANAIMRLEHIYWEEQDPLNQSKRASLPKMISIQEGQQDHHGGGGDDDNNDARHSDITMRMSGMTAFTDGNLRMSEMSTDTTGSPSGGRVSPSSKWARPSARNSSFVTSDTNGSDGVEKLKQNLAKVKESSLLYNNSKSSSLNNSRTSSPAFDAGFESDITESSEEEDSVYDCELKDDDDQDLDNIAVREVKTQPHRVSTMTVPEDFHWHAEKSQSQRELMRKQAQLEHARISHAGILAKTKELKQRRSFEDGGIDLEQVSSGESNELDALKRLQEQRRSQEKARIERAAFKAQRLKDLQNRLSRASGGSAASRFSDMSGISGASSERVRPSSFLDKLEENLKEEAAEEGSASELKEEGSAAPTVEASTLSKSKSATSKKKKQKKKKSDPKATDDHSVESTNSNSSTGSRKSAKKKSILAAERRAQEKMAALSQVMASETLESYVQEKEAEEKEAVFDMLQRPSGASAATERSKRRSLRLEQSIRKAEEKANQKLEELALLTDGAN